MVVPSLSRTPTRFVQLKKENEEMVVTLPGISTVVNAVQFSKAQLPIEVRLSGNVM